MSDLIFGNCFYSETKKDVLYTDGESAGLRRQSVEVFSYLADNPDTVLSRDDIQNKVWKDLIVTDDSLNQCISEIRKALGDQDRQILKTLPRRGYMLVSSTSNVDQPGDQPGDQQSAANPSLSTIGSFSSRNVMFGIAALVVAFGVSAMMLKSDESKTNTAAIVQSLPKSAPLTISVIVDDSASEFIKSVAGSTRVALSRYRSVSIVNGKSADLRLKLSDTGADNSVSLELDNTASDELLFAEKLQATRRVGANNIDEATESLASRIAGMIASPGGGAVARHLLNSSKDKPVSDLTNNECFAYGYGCTNCSGELDPITQRATQCLAALLKREPENARAWGLQSTIYARQYAWSSALPEPARTNLGDRTHLVQLAIDAANTAEQLSDGTDTSVYWGMSQAYAASCQVDKLRTVVDRGLQINPSDPSLLGAFGSWLAYNGDWDEGVQMVQKALEIEPRFYKRWWLFAEAKRHYARGNYEKALSGFRKSYNERNWLSHLQLAYTLPHLGRKQEAIAERKILEKLYPSVTIENVLEFYKTYCFDNTFLEKVRWALTEAGLPSRGSSEDLDQIQPVSTDVIKVNGFNLEYKDVGKGIPIVFVHGSISDYRAWSHYQNPISEDHRFISYSLRYAGSQSWPDEGENYGIDTDADDLIALIETLNTGPVFTVSWSRGGRVTGVAALKRPDLFLGNIHFEPIVNQLANTTDKTILTVRDNFFSRFDDSNKAFNNGYIEKGSAIILENVFELDRGRFPTLIMPLRAMNRDAARNMALQLAKENIEVLSCESLGKTTTPTMVIRGDKTNAWWQHVVRRYHECIPESEFVTMDGVNHDGPIRNPDILKNLIVDFVDKHRPAG